MNLIHKTVILAMSLSFASCVANVSNDPNYPTGYQIGATYELQQPVYIEEYSDSPIRHLRPFGYSPYGPKSKEEHLRFPAKHPDVVGIAERGKRYTVTNIDRHWNIEYGPSVHVMAGLIELSDLHVDEDARDPGGPSFFGGLPKLNSKFLKQVSGESGGR